MRIASLLPSATEIVCAVGARDELVGISHECDFPAGMAELPILTRPRRAMPGSSGEIDRSVREMLAQTLTVYEVEVERLRELRPEVIVTQDLCEVCAVSIGDVRRALRELADDSTQLVSLQPTRLQDVWNDVRRVGEALGRAQEGERAAQALEQRCAELGERAAKLERPSVLTVEWLDPVMIGGTWMPELVHLAGGSALVSEPGQHAPTLDLAALAELSPDVVLIKPCGFDLERSTSELQILRDVLPWEQWEAARSGRVYLADGNAFFNRPGPRLVESAEILAACIHPSTFGQLAQRHSASLRTVRSAPSGALTLEPLRG